MSRAIRWGFVIGALIHLPAVIFALSSPIGEDVLYFLTPGSLLLRPLGDATADWPGALNVGLAAVANGVVYAAVAVVIAMLVNAIRR